jgi:hypothetical protein
MNHNFKISSVLEVPPDAHRGFIGQLSAIVIFSTIRRLEDSVSYSIPIMNITFDFEVAEYEFRNGMCARCRFTLHRAVICRRVRLRAIQRARGNCGARDCASDTSTCHPGTRNMRHRAAFEYLPDAPR